MIHLMLGFLLCCLGVAVVVVLAMRRVLAPVFLVLIVFAIAIGTINSIDASRRIAAQGAETARIAARVDAWVSDGCISPDRNEREFTSPLFGCPKSTRP